MTYAKGNNRRLARLRGVVVLLALSLCAGVLAGCPSGAADDERPRRPRNTLPSPDHRCMACPRYDVHGWE